jgi:hypothetical protein
VNNVCFCFPFFFAFPDSTALAFILLSLSSAVLSGSPTVPLLQADPTGVASPNIFFSDWLPLLDAFCLVELDAGSSGNRAFDKGAGAPTCAGAFVLTSVAPGPDTEEGARNPEAELDDQGVFLEA